jgi:hypothetical protein
MKFGLAFLSLIFITACADPSFKRSTINNHKGLVDYYIPNTPLTPGETTTSGGTSTNGITTSTTDTSAPTSSSGESPSSTETTGTNTSGSGGSSGSNSPTVVNADPITDPLLDAPDSDEEDLTIPEISSNPICPNTIPGNVTIRAKIYKDSGTSYSYRISIKNTDTVKWDWTICFYYNHMVENPKNSELSGTQPHWKMWSTSKLNKNKVRIIGWTASPGNVGTDQIRSVYFSKTKDATCPLLPNYCD